MTPNQKKQLLSKFSKLYPKPKSELNFKNDFQLLIAVVLSAQCTDKKVNEVTPSLFEKYPDFKTLGSAKIASLEAILRPINYYKTKSKNIKALAVKVSESFQGAIPETHPELTSLPGVGRKTANVVLSEKGLVPTFPVDTHVFRLAKRLGLASGKTPTKVEEELMKQFPKSTWRNLHHWLIFHGRRVCKARDPQCSACILNTICPSSKLK